MSVKSGIIALAMTTKAVIASGAKQSPSRMAHRRCSMGVAVVDVGVMRVAVRQAAMDMDV